VLHKGKVIKSTGKWYNVLLEDNQVVAARIRGKMRLEGAQSTNPVTVGDEVAVDIKDNEDTVIVSVEPRINYIERKSVNLSKRSQLLAANIDRAYLLVTLVAPVTHLAFIDRFLVSAESFRIPVTLLFNKTDILFEEDLETLNEVMNLYRRIGYECHPISALNPESIAFLRDEINGKQVMISGHSGTGKSTLVNSLDPSLNLRTGEISMAHLQGQHTTTFAEMHPLSSGGFIIDTPGIKAFGIVDIEREVISHYFPEMRELLGACRFHNCQHLNEPGCAVKEALENGEIAASRYATYYDLMTEDREASYR
jgi:ribosome biogenesis GTPase / thiamine phosphate phosphatase